MVKKLNKKIKLKSNVPMTHGNKGFLFTFILLLLLYFLCMWFLVYC